MNDNFKNSVITIVGQGWTVPLAIAIPYIIEESRVYVYLLVFSFGLLLSGLILALIFFGSGKLLQLLSGKHLLFMASLFTAILGSYFLVKDLNASLIVRITWFLLLLFSWSVIVLRIRNISSIRLLKSFFKENLLLMDGWIAAPTENEQGTDYREINLEGCSLKKLVFTIRPSTPFWRAGCKLSDPNGSILPLRSNNSLLFHMGSTESENRFGITVYINGKWVETVNKTLPLNPDRPIDVKFEINDKNFIKCFINGTVEYEHEERINPRLLKKAYLAAWGDEHNFRVEFDGIGYLTR